MNSEVETKMPRKPDARQIVPVAERDKDNSPECNLGFPVQPDPDTEGVEHSRRKFLLGKNIVLRLQNIASLIPDSGFCVVTTMADV